MTDLIRWEYAGHEFKVAEALTPDQRDGVCSVLLSEYDSRAERMSDNHRSHSPVKNNSDDQTHYPAPQSPLEDDTDALETVYETLGRRLRDQQGLCRVCGKKIEHTHKRGRPRLTHAKCKS